MTALGIFVLGVALLTGCASGPPMERAISTHNIFRSVLVDLDQAYTPVMAAADSEAREQTAGDSEAYLSAVKPWLDAAKALAFARQTEQAMHLAIRQWEATGKDSGVLRETYACAAIAVDRMATAFGTLPRGSPLYAAAFAVSLQLREMADGGECGVTP